MRLDSTLRQYSQTREEVKTQKRRKRRKLKRLLLLHE